MAIIQDAYYIPDNIATGLLTGKYVRNGSVVRYAAGPKRGRIVIHGDSVNYNTENQALDMGTKALQFAQKHKNEIIIGTIGVGVICTGVWVYYKWKNYEPKVVVKFREALKIYTDAIRVGNMDINKIIKLMDALTALTDYSNHEKRYVQISMKDLEVLVNQIYNYTVKLLEDNSIKLPDDNLHCEKEPMINLYTYLDIQREIFKMAG